jgi:rare lipoprotein A
MVMRLLAAVTLIGLLFVLPAHADSGLASVYANGDGHAGSKTANGEQVNPSALTAAHRTLPFGTPKSP